MIVHIPEPYTVPAEGRDVFRCFVIPMDLPEDKYVRASNSVPAIAAWCDHTLFFLDNSGVPANWTMKIRASAMADGKSRFCSLRRPRWLSPRRLPSTPARWHCPPNPQRCRPVLQTHFHPTGKEKRSNNPASASISTRHPPRPSCTAPWSPRGRSTSRRERRITKSTPRSPRPSMSISSASPPTRT